MASVASPRPSTSIQTPTSTRSSFDAEPRSSTHAPLATQRRTRAALRDYYGLKATSSNQTQALTDTTTTTTSDATVPFSDLDRADLDPATYVQTLLAQQNLATVLGTESSLVSDIRGLDGERKALVYDNYSKLIAATETIRRMKTSMDPLAPITSTLAPAIANIAETAAGLSKSLVDRVPAAAAAATEAGEEGSSDVEGERQQRETVRWVLDAPQRLRGLMQTGKSEVAHAEYAEVERVLLAWEGVEGVEDVKKGCEEALG